jgi:hypothetical protein
MQNINGIPRKRAEYFGLLIFNRIIGDQKEGDNEIIEKMLLENPELKIIEDEFPKLFNKIHPNGLNDKLNTTLSAKDIIEKIKKIKRRKTIERILHYTPMPIIIAVCLVIFIHYFLKSLFEQNEK